MKKDITLVLVAVAAFIILISYRSGPPVATTCAPGETSCATNSFCHDDFPANSGGLFGEITIDGGVPPGNLYVPGQTYMLMSFVGDTSYMGKIYGFQTVAKLSDGSRAGMVMITNPTKTRMDSSIDGNEYVSQTTNGSSIMGIHDWMYDWTAPPPGSGKVVIYTALLAADGDGTANGDHVYTDSLVLNENTTGFPEQFGKTGSLIRNLFPVPFNKTLTIECRQSLNRIFISDVTGKIISSINLTDKSSSSLRYDIDTSHLSDGIFLLVFTDNNGKKEIIKAVKSQSY